jgi:hypothetical protein
MARPHSVTHSLVSIEFEQVHSDLSSHQQSFGKGEKLTTHQLGCMATSWEEGTDG